MNKKEMSEQDIRTKFITPAIVETAGWDRIRQLKEEYEITAGTIHVHGQKTKRGKKKTADYVLFYKPNIPIAVVEAKNNNHSIKSGMSQALQYAEMMDVPFVYSSNGDGFLEHDRTAKDRPPEREMNLNQFPTPHELWQRYINHKGFSKNEERIILQEYYAGDQDKTPRYYQLNAINRTVEAIARGQQRILLVMATGTGKTFTAFQIIWRLWKAGVKKRILFLADRKSLVNQTMTNDFKPFEGVIHKIQKRTADKSYEVYMALYQSITGAEEEKKTYKKFSPGFFDLVVVDECHRGSVNEDGEWREILEYFGSATQIGLTATPKETEHQSNIAYFNEPVYFYSLSQGIRDGYLAPYKVIRLVTDKDTWRPNRNQRDKYGQVIPDRVYQTRDQECTLILEERCKTVARRVTQYLKATNRFNKTIIFCQDIDHAERMRSAMVNENPDLAADNRWYVVQITSSVVTAHDDLDNFVIPNAPYPHPIIAVTSKLMSTGVDAQDTHLIVIDQEINSLGLFKQIIGRGTRVREDLGKMFFTIMDFRGVTNHFADPDFDGDPIQIYEPGPDEPVTPPEPEDADGFDENEDDGFTLNPDANIIEEGNPNDTRGVRRIKYYVNGVPVRITHEMVKYIDAEGKQITESMRSYCRKSLLDRFRSLDDFLGTWNDVQRKQAIIDELEEHGIMLTELREEVGHDLDMFDLICHVAFDCNPLTRTQRRQRVSDAYLDKYSEKARAVLEALLDKYADQGIADIGDIAVLKLHPFNELGRPLELVKAFGGKEQYMTALQELQRQLYNAA